MSHSSAMIVSMRSERFVTDGEVVYQPRLLTVPEASGAVAPRPRRLPTRVWSERSRETGLAGVAQARAALAAAAQRAEIERADAPLADRGRAAARTAGKAA